MRRTWTGIAVAALVLTAAIAGCGLQKETSQSIRPQASARAPQAEPAPAADKTCEEYRKKALAKALREGHASYLYTVPEYDEEMADHGVQPAGEHRVLTELPVGEVRTLADLPRGRHGLAPVGQAGYILSVNR